MEDFYETRIDGVHGEIVGLFGVFDGLSLSLHLPHHDFLKAITLLMHSKIMCYYSYSLPLPLFDLSDNLLKELIALMHINNDSNITFLNMNDQTSLQNSYSAGVSQFHFAEVL